MALAAIDDGSALDDIGTSPPTLDDGAYDNRLRLNDIGAPLALLDDRACVLAASPSAAALLARFQLATELPAPLPPDLARELAPPVMQRAVASATDAAVLGWRSARRLIHAAVIDEPAALADAVAELARRRLPAVPPSRAPLPHS